MFLTITQQQLRLHTRIWITWNQFWIFLVHFTTGTSTFVDSIFGHPLCPYPGANSSFFTSFSHQSKTQKLRTCPISTALNGRFPIFVLDNFFLMGIFLFFVFLFNFYFILYMSCPKTIWESYCPTISGQWFLFFH